MRAKSKTCTNCDGPLPVGHGCHDRTGRHYFCDTCASIGDALSIGAGEPVILYEKTDPIHAQDFARVRDARLLATSWTGVTLGTVVHKSKPAGKYGMRGAVRYRVRMLDGSLWHGSGPTENGNYIRLRRMAQKG